MKRVSLLAPLCLSLGALAFAQPPKDAPKDTKPAAAQPEMKLPAGWTDADMKACMDAGTPGAKHELLAKSIGCWSGASTMWMTPGADPIKSECAMTVSDFMDGRFTKWEMAGDVPGMGPMKGMGLYGYNNVTQKFMATWVTNCGTEIMNGTGELSSDAKTFTWSYTTTCPITKKPTAMRDIERHTGPDSFTLETWGTDPKSGKEFKMMEAAFTRATPATKTTLLNVSNRTAEVACASCVYHMDGAKGCSLAVKLDGKTYLVDGAKVDGHEWCEKSLNAVVNGSVENNRFIATKLVVK